MSNYSIQVSQSHFPLSLKKFVRKNLYDKRFEETTLCPYQTFLDLVVSIYVLQFLEVSYFCNIQISSSNVLGNLLLFLGFKFPEANTLTHFILIAFALLQSWISGK
jgi:hypothetical protein